MLRKKIKKPSPLSSVGSRDVVGVDLTSNHLKIGHIRVSSSRKELLNLLTHDISSLSTEEIAKIIRSFLDQLNIKHAEIVSIVTSPMAVIKNLEIPSINPQEIREIINLQAGRHTPYAREDIIVDYINIDIHKNHYTKILLIIAVRNLIKRQFEIFDKVGVKVENAAFLPEALARFIATSSKLTNLNLPLAIVHIDENYSDFIVTLKNNLLFVRSMPIGTQHLIQEKDRHQVKFLDEIKRSIEVYQSQDINKNPITLIITGAIDELRSLEEFLSSNLHLTIRMITYPRTLTISEEASSIMSAAKYLSFLSVVAPPIIREELNINLLPEDIKLRRALEERGNELTISGVFVLTIFVLLFFIFVINIYFKTNYIKSMETKYNSLNQKAQELEADFTKVGLVRKYLSNRGYALEVLSELYDILLTDMEFSDIRYVANEKFSVKGTTGSMSTVFSFVDKMEHSDYFKDVKTRYTTKRKDGLRDVTDFDITCLLDK